MSLLSVNLLLAVVWAGLQGSFTLFNLISGYLIGFGVLWVVRPLFGISNARFFRGLRVAQLLVYFLKELLLSSLQVVWVVVTPWRTRPQAAIVEMPLDVKTDTEILLVTSLISLTPGTLSLEVSPDRSTLFVHTMFGDDPGQTIDDLKSGMEHRVAEVFRS